MNRNQTNFVLVCKRKRAVAIAGLCLLFVLLLAACGGTVSMEGKWGLSSMNVNGSDYLATLQAMGADMSVRENMYFEFAKDGTVKIGTGFGDPLNGTYKLKGNKLSIVNEQDQTLEAVVEGDSFTVVQQEGADANTVITYTILN